MQPTASQAVGFLDYLNLKDLSAGDQVGNLWWRLLNGEVPKKQPKAIVMLIGTNDLTADDCDQSQAASLAGVVGIVDRYSTATKSCESC